MCLLFFAPLFLRLVPAAAVGGLGPVELPFQILFLGDLALSELFLAELPLLQELIQQAISEADCHVLFREIRVGGVCDLVEPGAGIVLIQFEQSVHHILCEEYLKFAEVMMDKPQSYYAFEVLYWCGIREGELLALTPADFDLDKGLLSITKSYQRLKGRDVITDPKTPKSVRVIQMPQFLTDEIRDYLKSLYKVQPDQRIFEVTKSYLHHEMDRGAKEAGVKRIRIHDLRHSHVSLLIEMGFSALAIADRVGHESVDITYKYAHLFPSKQQEMAQKLDMERKEE